MQSSTAFKTLAEMVDLLETDLMGLFDDASKFLDMFIIPKKSPIMVGLPPEKAAGSTHIPNFKPQLCVVEFFCRSRIE